jgi:hypothetical protein
MLDMTREWKSSFVCYMTHQSTSRLRWAYRHVFEADRPEAKTRFIRELDIHAPGMSLRIDFRISAVELRGTAKA